MHTIYVVGVMVVIPTICVIVGYFKSKQAILPLFCKWFVFWAVGVRSFTGGLMQVLNPSYTANLLQVAIDNALIIQEMGFANIAIGVLAGCSLFFQRYRKPAALCSAIFLAGAAALHISRISIIDLSEFMSLAGDLLVVVVAIMVFILENKKRQSKI